MRSYLLLFAVAVQVHVALRRNQENGKDLDTMSVGKIEVESGVDSSTLSFADMNMSADVITIQGVTRPNPIKFIENCYKRAKAKFENAKKFIVKTVYLARQKWDAVRNSLKLTTELSMKTYAAILSFIQLFKQITAKIKGFGLEKIFDGRFTLSDLKIFGYIKETWQIVKDILASTMQMRQIIYWSREMLQLIKNIKALAGFAKATAATIKSGAWKNGSLMDVSGETAEYSEFAAEAQDIRWYSKAWVKANAPLLEETSSTISGGVEFFEKSARRLEGIEKVIAPLGKQNDVERAVHITMNGFDIANSFNDLGDEYKNVRDGVDHTYRPMADQSRQVSVSFYSDSKAFEPGRVDKSKCEAKGVQFLDNKLKYDSSSMWCIHLMLTGKQVCWCKASWRDCYVKKDNREEPKELEGCFIPYVPGK